MKQIGYASGNAAVRSLHYGREWPTIRLVGNDDTPATATPVTPACSRWSPPPWQIQLPPTREQDLVVAAYLATKGPAEQAALDALMAGVEGEAAA